MTYSWDLRDEKDNHVICEARALSANEKALKWERAYMAGALLVREVERDDIEEMSRS